MPEQHNPIPARNTREFFATHVGFVLAAAGSAVGLGNMWRFSYQAAEGGGAAFVVLYLLMTFLIGVPIMTAEFAIGRQTRLSPIGAVRKIAGTGWIPLGVLFVLTPTVILAYFSVISGWALTYLLDAFTGFSEAPAARHEQIATGKSAIAYHLFLMTVTITIVMAGVKKGIERAGLILMPALFLILIGLAIWAATLPGGEKGYSFYLKPSFDALMNPSTFRQAASQAFLSLSVGMGIMITYASYLPRNENLNRQASLVALSDFSVAFISGLVVFPVIFAFGLSEEISESTIATLFISIPRALLEMGLVGQVVGVAFFVALVVAGLTSSVSLLEVGTATLMDKFGLKRKPAALITGVVAAGIGVFPALSLKTLGVMDKITGELLVVGGVVGIAILVGWRMKSATSELVEGATPFFRRLVPIALFLLRYLVPPFLAVILWLSFRDTHKMIFA